MCGSPVMGGGGSSGERPRWPKPVEGSEIFFIKRGLGTPLLYLGLTELDGAFGVRGLELTSLASIPSRAGGSYFDPDTGKPFAANLPSLQACGSYGSINMAAAETKCL